MAYLNQIALIFAFVVLSFSADATSKLKECDYCKYHYQCATGYCYNYKCVWRSSSSVSKCFLPLCAYCTKSRDCASGFCYKNKCVPKLNPYYKKCFPPTPTPTSTATATPTPTPTMTAVVKKPNCSPCTYAHECDSHACTVGKCGPPYVVRHCPRDLCEYCIKHSNCKSRICYHGKCVSYRYSRECH